MAAKNAMYVLVKEHFTVTAYTAIQAIAIDALPEYTIMAVTLPAVWYVTAKDTVRPAKALPDITVQSAAEQESAHIAISRNSQTNDERRKLSPFRL